MAKVLVLDPVHEAGLDRLRAAPGIDLVYLPEPDETSIRAHLGDADAVILRARRLPESAFRSAGRLRLVSRHGVGCDNLDFGLMAACGITVAITANANFVSVAEHAFALMLAACKRIPQGDAAVRANRWSVREALGAREIMGARLLVIGFGRTGSAFAERARAFGAQILVHDPMLPPDTHLPEGYQRIGRLEEGLSQADIVSLHVPATPRTHHLIGPSELALMPTGSILINTARGGIVEEKALPPALEALRPALYATDVLDSEPPAPDDPLLSHDQVILTPHSAAMTNEGTMRMSDHAAQNVLDFLSGRLRPEMVAFAP